MKTALFFDLDGTLVDSLGDICAHLNGVRERHYQLPPLAEEVLRPFIGHGVDFLAAGGCPELPSEEHPRVVELFRASYLKSPGLAGRAYPGVEATLRALQEQGRFRFVVVTNKHSGVAEGSLKHYLPSIQFEGVFGPDRVARHKPDPEHLWTAARAVGAVPGEGVMVGDHEVDRQCAEAAGVPFLAAAYGFGGVQGPEGRILTHFSQLLEHLPTR